MAGTPVWMAGTPVWTAGRGAPPWVGISAGRAVGRAGVAVGATRTGATGVMVGGGSPPQAVARASSPAAAARPRTWVKRRSAKIRNLQRQRAPPAAGDWAVAPARGLPGSP